MAFKGESTQNVRKLARKQGMHTLFEDGMIKAIRGLTTIDEVMRITQREMLTEAIGHEKAVTGRGGFGAAVGWRRRDGRDRRALILRSLELGGRMVPPWLFDA